MFKLLKAFAFYKVVNDQHLGSSKTVEQLNRGNFGSIQKAGAFFRTAGILYRKILFSDLV